MQLLYCSVHCNGTAFLNRHRPVFESIACAECGTTFTPRDSKGKFCTIRCCHKARDRIYVTRRNQRVAAGEKFKPIEVLERDGWRCQACGAVTPSSLRGTKSPFAPEVDHIVSIRDGGEHTLANTQCLCRSCNSRKARLFG